MLGLVLGLLTNKVLAHGSLSFPSQIQTSTNTTVFTALIFPLICFWIIVLWDCVSEFCLPSRLPLSMYAFRVRILYYVKPEQIIYYNKTQLSSIEFT